VNTEQTYREIEDKMITHRRWFHKNPETGFEVHNTYRYIIEQLQRFNFDAIESVAGTGIKAVAMKGKDYKTIAFRADMDALSINEDTELEFSSTARGIMHACGHDAHMAILLGFAQWLSSHRDQLKYNVVLIFQPAEESVGGALPMIKEGVLENPDVDAIFGLHLFPGIKQGFIGLREGPLMAQTCEFDIEIIGKSAHGAMPQDGADALMAAAQFVGTINSVISRRLDPTKNMLITIGKLQAGDRRNVIAEKAKIEGIIRTFYEENYDVAKDIIADALKGLETTYRVKTKYLETAFYPIVNNDGVLVKRVRDLLPEHKTIDANPLMTAEDFSFFQKAVPGVFFLLGTRNEQKGYVEQLHSSKFDFDETVLSEGLQMFVSIAKGIGL